MFPFYKSRQAKFLSISAVPGGVAHGSGSAAPILRGARSAAAKDGLSPISPVDECERRFGFPLRPCATAKKEADHEKRFDIPGGAGGEQRQAGADRKAAGRSAGWPCPHPCRGLWRVPFGFR